MSNPMQDGMAEAMRLTNEGRLAEATAVIQRTLGGAFVAPAAPDVPAGADQPETIRRVVNEAAQPTVLSQSGPTRKKHTLRPAPRPSRDFRGAPRHPGGAPKARAGVPTPDIVSAGGRFVERSYTNHTESA